MIAVIAICTERIQSCLLNYVVTSYYCLALNDVVSVDTHSLTHTC